MPRFFALCGLVLASAAAIAQTGPDADVKLNQLQLVGTHNSYHAGLAPSVAKVLQDYNPRLFAALDYTHPSLTKQLDDGVRQMEIDIFADSKGGLYAHPYIDKLAQQKGLPADPPYNADGVMNKPGFKVMHVQDVDQRSVCEPFTECLKEVRTWSRQHPDHMPVFLLIETKEGALHVKGFPSTEPETFTPAVFDAFDKEVRSVFRKKDLITPADVQGKYPTLNAAIAAGNWPVLAKARGKIIFLLDQRKVESVYTDGYPSLKGRIAFTNALPGQPDAAFTEANDFSPEAIDALVKQGYHVRTRTDEDTVAARTNDTARRDAVFASGAQILSTDYPGGEPAASGYSVAFPGGALVRCNPLAKAAGCTDAGLQPAK